LRKKQEIQFIRTSELLEKWQKLEALKRNNRAGIGTDQGLTPGSDIADTGEVYDNE